MRKVIWLTTRDGRACQALRRSKEMAAWGKVCAGHRHWDGACFCVLNQHDAVVILLRRSRIMARLQAFFQRMDSVENILTRFGAR